MSFFNKVFASVGIGAASVDTKLEKETYMPGETMKGSIFVKGGSVDQEIDEIILSVYTTYVKESNDRKYNVSACIERMAAAAPFIIRAGEERSFPFSFKLPEDTPITIGRTKIWLSTGLDIKNAMDPSDQDYIKVIPTNLMAAVLHSVQDLGFRLREADCQEAPRRLRGRTPFIQEFEYVPASGRFRGLLDELEVAFFPAGNGNINVLLQVDRRARGLAGLLSEALEMDETHVSLTLSPSDISVVSDRLERTIEKFA